MKKLAIIGLMLFLTACATHYQPEDTAHPGAGGYSEKQLSKDLYEVHFSGNGNTSRVSVEKMFLRRCAELTKQNGYKYFYFVGINAAVKYHLINVVNSEKYGDYLTEKFKLKNPGSYEYRYSTKAVIKMSNKKMDGAIDAINYIHNYSFLTAEL